MRIIVKCRISCGCTHKMVTPQALFCQFDRLTTHLRRRTVTDFSHRDDVLLLSDPNQFDRFSTGLSLLPMASMICFFSVRLASSSFASSLLASPSSKSIKLFRSRATWSSFPMPISLQHFSVWKKKPRKVQDWNPLCEVMFTRWEKYWQTKTVEVFEKALNGLQ